ncbi:hypothetical protein Ahy_B05g076152 [Arachis hypogaea]|uniref:RNase H type-1 domain-containing protein n=1 Tax=Arachis hypogaea TaxID=3818 RepID=A0A444Z2Q8_ARAHY|nr:hypothetical protein Ahy_B05g076152 [Arachis hypogaea]
MLNQLWKARNSMVFEERVLQIEEELEKVRSLFKEFWQTQIREETRTRRNEQEHPLMQNWECPPNSDLKVNVDTAIFRNFNGGVGVVVRDNWDQIMAVASWVIPYPLEPREAEAYAAFVGKPRNIGANAGDLEDRPTMADDQQEDGHTASKSEQEH